jgi:hypothetical protein
MTILKKNIIFIIDYILFKNKKKMLGRDVHGTKCLTANKEGHDEHIFLELIIIWKK